MTLDGFLLLQRRMSVQQLLALFDAHAAKTLSDYELSLRLHRLDGRGVLAADGAGADGGAAAASHATALERRTLSHSPPSEKHGGVTQARQQKTRRTRTGGAGAVTYKQRPRRSPRTCPTSPSSPTPMRRQGQAGFAAMPPDSARPAPVPRGSKPRAATK